MKYISTRTLDNTNGGNRYLHNKNNNNNNGNNDFIPQDLAKLLILLVHPL